MKLKAQWIIITLLAFTLATLAAPKLVFEDNFDKDTGKWVSFSGDWFVEKGYLINEDINHTTSNVYCQVPQKGKIVTYEYKILMLDTIVEYGPLCGLHFYVEDPEERGESYFFYQAKPFLIKMVKTGPTEAILNPLGDVIAGTAEVGKEYVLKAIFDTKKGEITLFINGEEVAVYEVLEDLDPGEYISFRTNRTTVKIDYIKVWVEN